MRAPLLFYKEGKFKSVSKNIKTLKIMTKKETAKFIVLL